MATRRPASGVRRHRVNKARAAEHVYGVPVPEALHEAIEAERGNLAKADSLLGCLVISMEYEADGADRPYYPDVAQLARDLVKQSINRLDSLVLQRLVMRNKVKESLCLPCMEDGYAVFDHDPMAIGVCASFATQ